MVILFRVERIDQGPRFARATVPLTPYDIDECWVEIAFRRSLMQSTLSALDVDIMM
jgi:hypothetical protein